MDTLQRDKLISVFKGHCQLSSSSLESLLSACEIKDFQKGEHIAKAGKADSHEYFVLDGVVHRYLVNEDGEFITTGFYLSQTVVTPHFARTVNGKSVFNLQALTDVSLAEMPVKVLDSLRYSYDDIRTFGLKVVERELLKSLSSEVSHRSMTAKDRLLAFREQYPNLENLIPHTCIASYLGITPVSFSRLRNELTKS